MSHSHARHDRHSRHGRARLGLAHAAVLPRLGIAAVLVAICWVLILAVLS